jgi:hypothetical protein
LKKEEPLYHKDLPEEARKALETLAPDEEGVRMAVFLDDEGSIILQFDRRFSWVQVSSESARLWARLLNRFADGPTLN